MSPDLLQLRGMKLPEPVGWWPLAPGWWILAILLILAVWLVVYLIRKYRSSVTFKAGKILKSIKNDFNQGELDQKQLLTELNQLMKRVALARFSASETAHLSGDEWVSFLVRNSKLNNDNDLKVLASGPYQKEVEYDPLELFSICERWIKTAGRS